MADEPSKLSDDGLTSGRDGDVAPVDAAGHDGATMGDGDLSAADTGRLVSGASSVVSDDEGAPAHASRAGASRDFRSRSPFLAQGRAERTRAPHRSWNTLITIVAVVAALVLGLVAGMVLSPIIAARGNADLAGRIAVEESELDSVLGTYTFGGKRIDVTIREAILESTTLEAARNADGTYNVPSVDSVLSIARNHVLEADAQERGLSANEDDARAYALQTLGTDDFAQIAAGYSMDVEQVTELLVRSSLLAKLRDQVVGATGAQEPAAPPAVEAGKEDEPQQQYASYIMGLVGDEWDAVANTWAREDGPYREQLKDYTISNEAATYSAAQAAYYVAYAQYSQSQQQVSSVWTNYVNQLLSDVSVELVTLVA